MSSGAMGGAASGAATGTMIMPGWGTLIGAGLGAVGGMMGDKAQKRAAKQAKLRYQGALNNVTTGASVARQDAAEQFGNAQSNVLNRNAEAGLTGTTAWDAGLNKVMTGRSRAMSGITQDEAAAKNNIMGQYHETVSPNNWATGLSGMFSKMGVLGQMGGGAGGAGGGGGGLPASSSSGNMNVERGGVNGQENVANTQLQGGEADARMGGGGSQWDQILKMLGLG